ncbi:hypothetical protein EYC80_006951 [Monilinia laxa]|uniref:Uncharacterized protein n=1 Tax=Monilinia laxa TaxID=61186 RepID=A0A5N6JZN5_MONLA|nr:hypothetical protein EYC80_006951 [Monilinia laxa]
MTLSKKRYHFIPSKSPFLRLTASPFPYSALYIRYSIQKKSQKVNLTSLKIIPPLFPLPLSISTSFSLSISVSLCT